MKIRSKETGQVYEVLDGSIIPNSYEVVKKDIKVGEPVVTFEILDESTPELEEKKKEKKTVKTKKGTRNVKKESK